MGTVCIQCALKQLVEAVEAGRDPGPFPTFDETPMQHQARLHPSLQEAIRERRDLERRAQAANVIEAIALMNYPTGKERH